MLNICVVGSPIITYCFKDACNYLTSALDVGTSVILRTWLHDVTLTKIKTILSLLIWVKVSYIYIYKVSVWRSIQVPKKKILQTISVFDANQFSLNPSFQNFIHLWAFLSYLCNVWNSERAYILPVCTKIICTLRFHLQKRIFILVFRGVLYMKLS